MARGGRSSRGKKGLGSKGGKAKNLELGEQACAGPTHVQHMDSTVHSDAKDSRAKATVNVVCGLATGSIVTKCKAQELNMYEKMTKHIVVPHGKREQRRIGGGNCAPDHLNRAGAPRVYTRTTPVQESVLALRPCCMKEKTVPEVPSTPIAAGNKAAIAVEGGNNQKTGIKLSIKLGQKNRRLSLEPKSGESKKRRTLDTVQSCNKRIQELEDELKEKLDQSKSHAADMAAMETRIRESREEVQRRTLDTVQSCNKRIQELEDELKEKLDQSKSHAADMAAMETRIRESREEVQRRTLDTVQSCNKRIQELEDELKEKLDQSKSHAADMAAMETRIRESREEVQRLTSVAADMAAENCELKAKSQETLQTLASGSYAHDGANPAMLEAACKRVYNATIHLGKVLVEFEPAVKGCSACCEKTCDRASQLDASTHLQIDLTRSLQAKHNWGRRICRTLFLGFESASFDVHDEHEIFAPLNLRTHAAARFQQFVHLQEKAAEDMFSEDRMFRMFCVRKYREILPAELVMAALHPGINREIHRTKHGRFTGDEQIHRQFLKVARAAWLLHHLAFSFDPPASIFRMERVTLFDERYHNPVVSDGEPCEALQELEDHAAPVAFIITPALRVGKIIIKSQVFLIEQR